MKFSPENLVIRKLTSEDLSGFSSLIHLFNHVFEEADPAIGSDANLQRLLCSDNFIAVAAILENEVIGGLTAYVLPMYYSDFPEVFLYDMAVHPAYQRLGIGKKLINGLKGWCLQNGVKDFFVLAHEEDIHAVEFYHAAGGKSEKVVNFLFQTPPNY